MELETKKLKNCIYCNEKTVLADDYISTYKYKGVVSSDLIHEERCINKNCRSLNFCSSKPV